MKSHRSYSKAQRIKEGEGERGREREREREEGAEGEREGKGRGSEMNGRDTVRDVVHGSGSLLHIARVVGGIHLILVGQDDDRGGARSGHESG